MILNKKLWVEPMTLKAFVREQINEGKEIPMEKFGVFVGAETKISKSKMYIGGTKWQMQMQTRIVLQKEESKLPALNLETMELDASSGLENISQDDLATPRLKVLMQLSPELEELEGAKAGMIFNTVTMTCMMGQKVFAFYLVRINVNTLSGLIEDKDREHR